jgi:hypothetical protein
MSRFDFSAVANDISTNPAYTPPVLQQMMQNPKYGPYLAVIQSRMAKEQGERQSAQAAQGMQQQQPMGQTAQTTQQPVPQQAMAGGGIVAFKHGGEVRGYTKGGVVSAEDWAIAKTIDPATTDPLATIDEARRTRPQALAEAARVQGDPSNRPRPDASAPSIWHGIAGRPAIERADPAQRPEAGIPAAAQMQAQQQSAPAAPGPQYSADPNYVKPSPYALGLGAGGGSSVTTKGPGDRSGISSIAQYANDMASAEDGIKFNDPRSDKARAAVDSDYKQRNWRALGDAAIALGHDATVHPYYGGRGNILAAIEGANGSYKASDLDQQTRLAALDKAEADKRSGIAKLAVSERGQDVRNNQYLSTIRAQNSHANMKEMNQEQLIKETAQALYAQDVKAHQGIAGWQPQPPAMYKLAAMSHIAQTSSGFQVGAMRDATSQQADRSRWITAAAKNNPTIAEARLAQQYDTWVSTHGTPPPDAGGAATPGMAADWTQ